MKSTARKLATATFLVCATAVAAVGINIDQVNLKLKNVLSRFNNDKTIVDLTFTELKIDEIRALNFAFKSVFEKVGSKNHLRILVPEFSYRYNDGKPMSEGKVDVRYDLLKAFGQETLNRYAEELNSLPEAMSREYLKHYGEATTIETVVSEIRRDDAGQVISAQASVNLKVDLTKLPEEMSPEYVIFTDLKFRFAISQQGFEIQFSIALNPNLINFSADNAGMKDLIAELLSENEELYAEIGSFVASFDEFATTLVEEKR